MKYITALFFSLFAVSAFADAGTCDIQGNYTAEVAAAMKSACETAVQKTAVAIPPVEQATKWGTFAKEFAEALGIAAHQIGVSVNEFMASPAGYLAVFIILWKMLGGPLIAIAALAFGWYVVYMILRRIWTRGFIDREYKNIFGNLQTKYTRQYFSWKEAEDTQVVCSFLLLAVMLIVTIITSINV